MSEYYKFIHLNVVTMLEIRDDIQLGTLILKNIFSILLFSVILLNGKCAIGATPSEILEQQSKLFEEGFDAARDCLRKLNAAQTLLQSPTDTTNGTEQISSETLNRDLNVYTTIGELGREFILEETSTQRKGKILNHLTILAYSHFLIPGTIIDKEIKTNIFTKLGSGRSEAAEYFIQCLAYDESTTQFSLTQDRRSNTAMSSYMSIAHAASPFIRSGAIANGKEIIYRYSEIDRLIFSLVPKIEHYRWSFDKLSTLFEIFDELEPDLSALATKLYQINTEMTKTVDDHTSMNRLLSNIYFKRFEDIINKLKAEHPTEIADLNEEKISKLIKTRIKLYKKSVKDLQENQKVNALTDPHYTHFVYVLNKRAEMYELAKDILVRSRTLEAEQRRASRNNLYVLLSVHMQCVKHEESLEGFYINPIIEFLESDHSAEGKISPEAKIFTDIISVKYENSKIKYDIEFKDDLHERWTLQQARLMSIENGDLSKSAESIASTYERFTDSFKALLDDSLQLSTLFEMFKPYIAQYKKEVTKQLNIIEMSINKEIPSTPQKKKKKRSKKTVGQPPSTDQGGIKTSTDSSDSIPSAQEDDEVRSSDGIGKHVNVEATAEKSVDKTTVFQTVVSAQDQSLTSEQADATEQKEDSKQAKGEPKADELSTANKNSTPAEQMRLDRERQKAVKARIAHQQKVEKEKKDAELAVFAERKRLANLAKQEERERRAKLIEEAQRAKPARLAPQRQLVEEAVQNKLEDITTTSGMDKQPAAKAFVFNTKAAVFTPKSKIVTLPSAMEEQDSDEYESTNGDDLGDEQEHVGGNLSVPPLYGQAYDQNYAAWLAQQQAWQEYYASLGYQMIPYGYPMQPPH